MCVCVCLVEPLVSDEEALLTPAIESECLRKAREHEDLTEMVVSNASTGDSTATVENCVDLSLLLAITQAWMQESDRGHSWYTLRDCTRHTHQVTWHIWAGDALGQNESTQQRSVSKPSVLIFALWTRPDPSAVCACV